MFARQGGETALNFTPHASHRNAEDALAALHEVDDFVGGGALINTGAVAHEGDLGEVLNTALTEVFHGRADLLQGYASVQQPLDHLEDQDVTEAVEPLRSRAGGTADCGLHQTGPGPVVQLAVRDACGLAGGGTPVACIFVQHRKVLGEEKALSATCRHSYAGRRGL